MEPSPAAASGALDVASRWLTWLVVAGGVAIGALWLWALASWQPELMRTVVGGSLMPVGGACVLVVLHVAARSRLEPNARRAWRLFGLAYGAWWLSGIAWELLGRPALSWADVGNLGFFPLVLAGIFAFPAQALDRSARVRFWLDAGVVALGGTAGIWYFVLWPSVARGTTDLASVLTNAAYPIGDLLLLFAACAALLRRQRPGARHALTWLAVSLLSRFVGELIFGWETAAARHTFDALADLGWMTSCWALAAGAVAQRRAGRALEADDEPAEESQRVNPLPYVSVATLYCFLLSTATAAWGSRVGGVLIAAVAVTTLVLVRQFLIARDHARLVREATTRETEARFRSLVQHSSDVIAVLDVQGCVHYASPSVERVLGHAVADVIGHPFMQWVHPHDVAAAVARLATVRSEPGDGIPQKVRMRRADGEWRDMEVVGTDLSHDPSVNGIVVTARDVTERAALEAQLVHQAFHDPLTGLANRALFRDRVEHALERQSRREGSVVVLFLDLDDFKTVNDSLGHAAGDRLLIVVAERLLNATRGCDTVARLGGDEFAVLLENVVVDADATIVAERITASLARPVPLDGNEIIAGASLGIAKARLDDGADELLRNADVAMYKAKQRGRGGHQVFEQEMHTALVDRLELEADLRRALSDPSCAEFTVLFQPIIELADRRLAGVEALVRWEHPRRGLVSPASFIPIAESTGLIVPLGNWVLRRACAQATRWQAAREAVARETGEAAPPLTVTVNLSGRQLQHPGLLVDIAAALAESGLAPSSLVLEITESVIMHDTEASLDVLHALKALGVRLAIDDFGTGYSSLSYLQKFPIDILKIDKAFVDGIGGGGSDEALARTIVALGDMLRLRCVAEGIEDEAQREHLLAIGCSYGQGYLFARPMTADAVVALLCRTDGVLAVA